MMPYSPSQPTSHPDLQAPAAAGGRALGRAGSGRTLMRLACAGMLAAAATAALGFPNYPITPQQRATAQQVAHAGVPLSELRDNAPDMYKVKRGDTLWAISGMYLKHPWRWPELWGMNMQQIHNPHLIYPGQMLILEKSNGMATLHVGQPVANADGTVKLEPHVREVTLDDAIASVPLSAIEPFMNEAVVLNSKDELDAAPRIVAGPEGRVVLGRGDKAYVLGDVSAAREWRVFREPKALVDPSTHEVLGYEAAYVGTADLERQDGDNVPSIIRLTSVRQEAGIGDRLSPVPQQEFLNYAPHRPSHPMAGQVVSIYGEGLTAGQNQVVSLNRGSQDGMERGLVLALIHTGDTVRDLTNGGHLVKLPDEEDGLLFVFRVFDRVSYALILRTDEPVKPGDRFSDPQP